MTGKQKQGFGEIIKFVLDTKASKLNLIRNLFANNMAGASTQASGGSHNVSKRDTRGVKKIISNSCTKMKEFFV